jgi:hypothetical protein
MTKSVILVTFLLFVALPVSASLTEVQHKKNFSAANATTVAVTIAANSAGNLIAVGTDNNSSRTVIGVADNATGGSNTYVQATSALGTNGGDSVDVWYVLSAAHAGATTVTVTFSGAAGTFSKNAWVMEVSGFITAGFDLANNVTNGTGSGTDDNGASVTTTSTTGFVIGVMATGGTITGNPKTGNEFTAGGDISGGNAACSLISSTAAAHKPVWTDTGSNQTNAGSTAAFKETSGAALPGVNKRLKLEQLDP